jgi:hypothetical protein
LRWGKKWQIILHYLGTLHNPALGQAVNSNVNQIFRTFANFWNCEQLILENKTFTENHLMTARMVKVLQ